MFLKELSSKVKLKTLGRKYPKYMRKKLKDEGKKWINRIYAKAGNQPRHILFKPLSFCLG